VKLIVSAGANTVPMPEVTGQQYDAAVTLLKSQGFTNILPADEQPSDDTNVQVGEVFKQNPASGQDVAKSAPITLTVSSGPPEVAVPDVSGKSAADAANALGVAGFKTTTTSEASDTVESGKVIRTDPAAGATAHKGDTITIVVSSGKEQATVPSVTGLTKAGADSAITAAGLVPQAACVLNPTAQAGGKVTAQELTPGAKVDKGSTMKYTVETTDVSICP
jgi:serine/threonine-protein kinase